MLSLGADVAFGRNARIECFAAEGDLPGRPKLIIGSGSTFGDGVHIGCLNSIRIGQSVLGGSYILIVDHSHGHPRDDLAARELVPPHKRPIVSKGGITIEDGVWIGDGAVILAGAHIGEGAIIGANAVVRGKVACRTIYLGTPA